MKIKYSLKSFFVASLLLACFLAITVPVLLHPRPNPPSKSLKYDDRNYYDTSTPHSSQHIAFYLAWLVQEDERVNPELDVDFKKHVSRIRNGKLTPRQFLEIADGVILSDFMSEQGMQFSDEYYAHLYLRDFGQVNQPLDQPDEFFVKLQETLNFRYDSWKQESKDGLSRPLRGTANQ